MYAWKSKFYGHFPLWLLRNHLFFNLKIAFLSFFSFTILYTFFNKTILWAGDSIMGKILFLCMTDLDSIPHIPYIPLLSARSHSLVQGSWLQQLQQFLASARYDPKTNKLFLLHFQNIFFCIKDYPRLHLLCTEPALHICNRGWANLNYCEHACFNYKSHSSKILQSTWYSSYEKKLQYPKFSYMHL